MMSANDNEFKSPEIEVVANSSIEGEGPEDEDVTELPYGDEAEAEAEEYSSNQTTSYFGSFISKRSKVILTVTAVILVFCVAGFGSATARHNKTVVSSFNVSGSKSPKSSKTPKSSKSPKSSAAPGTTTTTSSTAISTLPVTTTTTTTAVADDIYRCNMTLTQYEAALRQLLHTITPQEVLNTPHSPQSRALNWFLYHDTITPPLCPPENDSELLQRYIMTSFYYATNGDNWTECSSDNSCTRTITAQSTLQIIGTNSWLTPTPTCSWGGLACTTTTTTTTTHPTTNDSHPPPPTMIIDHIEFENNNLDGTLPNELSSLTQLKVLQLEKGQLTGTIPSSFGSLSQLLVLDMDFNALSGSIPSELYNLVELRELDLNDNFLGGVLEDGIGGLVNLMYLQLDQNEFTGTLPREVGELKELVWAVFHGNNFSGEVPMSVCENRDSSSNPDGKLTLLTADCSDDGGPVAVVCSCCDYCG